MQIRHPLQAIPPEKRRWVFLPLLGLNVLLAVVFNVTGQPLTTEAAPNGIVSFELAGSVAQAQQILDSWNEAAQVRAALGLGLDFLYLFVYSTTIGLACVWAAGVLRAHRRTLAATGILLAWGQWLAASLDAVENAALATLLLGPVVAPWPQIARWAAIPKFALIFAGLIYVALGAVAHVSRWLRRRSAGTT